MATWRKTIQLNAVIEQATETENFSDEDAPVSAGVKDKIIAELNKATELSHFVGRVNRCTNVAALNRCLAAIYDEADRFKIWTGG